MKDGIHTNSEQKEVICAVAFFPSESWKFDRSSLSFLNLQQHRFFKDVDSFSEVKIIMIQFIAQQNFILSPEKLSGITSISVSRDSSASIPSNYITFSLDINI